MTCWMESKKFNEYNLLKITSLKQIIPKIKVSSEFADKIDDIINTIAIDSIITDKYIDQEFGI